MAKRVFGVRVVAQKTVEGTVIVIVDEDDCEGSPEDEARRLADSYGTIGELEVGDIQDVEDITDEWAADGKPIREPVGCFDFEED